MKRESQNHAMRFQEIEKQTKIMGDLQRKVIELAKEVEILTQDKERAEEGLRVSTSKVGRLTNENQELKQKLQDTENRLRAFAEERDRIKQQVQELHGQLDVTDRGHSEKIRRLENENQTLHSDVRDREEKLRLSTSQTSKLMGEIGDFKSRFEQLVRENDVLKNERQKVLQEVQKLHEQLGLNDRGYADKIGKLDRENKTLTEEYRQSQEQLRISTSQTAKLQN